MRSDVDSADGRRCCRRAPPGSERVICSSPCPSRPRRQLDDTLHRLYHRGMFRGSATKRRRSVAVGRCPSPRGKLPLRLASTSWVVQAGGSRHVSEATPRRVSPRRGAERPQGRERQGSARRDRSRAPSPSAQLPQAVRCRQLETPRSSVWTSKVRSPTSSSGGRPPGERTSTSNRARVRVWAAS